MRETTPEVWLIASPHLRGDMPAYLESVGGRGWFDRLPNSVSPAEALVEFAGRICYRSWEIGLNANITKIRTDSADYFDNLLRSGHGSVMEHASFTFVFQDVSRVFTHELVRHRAGVAISQESLRYVRLTDLGFRIPAILDGPDTTGEFRQSIVSLVEHLEEFQVEAAERFALDDAGVPFHYKKEVTSALRRLAPLGLSTSIVWTANLRTLRHCLEMRTAAGAEEEMRLVFGKVGETMLRECPLLFADYQVSPLGEWLTPHRKV